MPVTTHFLIIHGAYGNPDENWFPWLARELAKDGDVRVPHFPTPEGQSFKTWKKIADEAMKGFVPVHTVLIGHSIGAALALRLAEETKDPYKAIFCVCPFARDLGNPEFDPLNASFFRPPFDWQAVKRGADKIVCFAGDNDPYVPLTYSKEAADDAGAKLVIVKKGGHLNAAAGYREFPLLLDKIRQLS